MQGQIFNVLCFSKGLLIALELKLDLFCQFVTLELASDRIYRINLLELGEPLISVQVDKVDAYMLLFLVLVFVLRTEKRHLHTLIH